MWTPKRTRLWQRSSAALREVEIDRSALDHRLTEARLQALQAQIEPHFLFNALNTIASTIHTDPNLADALLTKLAALLRAAVRYPFMTAQVIGLIHYEALKLHLRRVPYRRPGADHRPIVEPARITTAPK